MWSVCGGKRCCTMRRAWLMFHVIVVMVLFWGSTMESSMMYAELAMCFGRYRSIHRGARLVLVNRRLEIRQFAGVTSRKMMSSVRTWLLWEGRKATGQNDKIKLSKVYWLMTVTTVNTVFNILKILHLFNITQWKDSVRGKHSTSIKDSLYLLSNCQAVEQYFQIIVWG